MSLGASMSSSFSTSTPVTSPNNLATQDILNQISGIAQALSGQLLQWGTNVFAGVNSVTSSNIAQYLSSAATSGILANASVSDYLSKYVPQQDQLIQDANSFNSKERADSEAATAGSGTAQAMDQGRLAAEKNLEGYGIDPSSGRYAALEQAQEAGKAAAVAGSEQQSRLATAATGRQLRSQAIAVGQQLPGQAVNALNSEVQSLTGAENSALGAANTGVNLTTPAIAALNTAASAPKFTPTGQNTQSSTVAGGGGGGSKGGGNDPFGNFGKGSADQGANSQAYDPVARPVPGAPMLNQPFTGNPTSKPAGPAEGTQQYDENGNPIAPAMGPVDPNLMQTSGGVGGPTDVINGGVDPNLLGPSADLSGSQGVQGSSTNPFAGSDPNAPSMDPGINNTGFIPGGFDQQNSPIQGIPTGGDIPGAATQTGFTPPDASNGPLPGVPDQSGFGNNQNFSGGYGPPAGSPGTGGYGASGGYGAPAGGYGASGGYGAPAAGGYSPGVSGQYSPGAGGQGGGNSGGAYGSGYTPGYSPGSQTSSGYGGGGYGGGGYARGGAIPDPSQRQQMQRPMGRGGFQMAGGGRVPASASPSGGARTDDVQASLNGRRPGVNVNVGEFVIPKDVAAWKGQEFFQKLIAQSRKMRVTAPAQGGQQPQPQAMG